MMVDLQHFVTTERTRYLSLIKEHAKLYDGIVIYGAGIYGRGLYRLLQENGVKVTAFGVTEGTIHPSMIDGVFVKEIDSLLKCGKEYLFLLAAASPVNQQMKANLQTMGEIKHCIDTPVYMDEILDDVFFRPVMEITARVGCSVHCRYCPQDLLMREYYSKTKITDMSLTDFKKCLDRLPNDVMLDFSGFAEPFLNHDMVSMLLYAADQGREIRLYTTFVGLTLDMFRQIENIPFRRVVVHLPDVKRYANIPMTDEFFSILRYAVDKQKKDGTPFIDMANCQCEPHPDVVKAIQNKIVISWHLIDRAGNLEGNELSSYCIGGESLYCSRAADMNHTVLLPNGDVVLCCMDYGLKHILGNLLRQSYDEILSGAEMQRIKKAVKYNGDVLCRHCTAAKAMPSDEAE